MEIARFIRPLLAISLLAAALTGCGVPGDTESEATAVSAVSTAMNVFSLGFQWWFDNLSPCALEVVVTETALAQEPNPDVVAELKQWKPLVLPADTQGVPVEYILIPPEGSASYAWPFTLRESVAPGAAANPACDWLPLDVRIEGPRLGKNTVIAVIGERGAISYR